MVAQVAEVNTVLLSVRKMITRRHQEVFDDEGSDIVDKQTGEHMVFRDDGNMFMFKFWCRIGGFQRQVKPQNHGCHP